MMSGRSLSDPFAPRYGIFNAIFMTFNAIFMICNGIFMTFNGIFMTFNGIFMTFSCRASHADNALDTSVIVQPLNKQNNS